MSLTSLIGFSYIFFRYLVKCCISKGLFSPKPLGRVTKLNVDNLLENGQVDLNTINAKAFSDFKQQVNKLKNYKVISFIDSKEFNFIEQHINELGKKYLTFYQYHYFCSVLQKKMPERHLVKISPKPVLDHIHHDRNNAKAVEKALSKLNRFFHLIFDLVLVSKRTIRFFVKRYDPSILKKFDNSEAKILWSGVNPQETNTNQDYKAQFLFLEKRGLAKQGQIIYIVPGKLSNVTGSEKKFIIKQEELEKIITFNRKVYLVLIFLMLCFKRIFALQHIFREKLLLFHIY